MDKINVIGTEITITKVNDEDYLSLTDMIKAKDGDFFVKDWLRNRNTMEFLGIWERLNNPDFNWGEYALIRNKSGLNNFKISVKFTEIKENDYILSISRYRELSHEDIEYDDPEEIIDRVLVAEDSIKKELKELKRMV